MSSWWKDVMDRRPWWMNGLMLFSAFMAFIYCPWDWLMRPVAEAEDVWFGILFRGSLAKITEPLHWAIYAAGAYGFWRMKAWMWPWAAVYVAQVAFAMFVWNIAYVGGFGGFMAGLASGGAFAALAVALWNSQEQFGRRRASLKDRYGDWALVTGASAGIGVEFARAIARDGMSCVLSARRKDRLDELASELEQNYGIETKIVTADLTNPDDAKQLAKAVEDLDLGLLVNNAGFGYAGRFDKQDGDRLEQMVQVNCMAPVILTSRLLPKMIERNRGAIVFTGSVAGRQPVPLHGLYSATKAFDLFIGESLWAELRDDGIDVITLEPGPTESEFTAVAGEDREVGEPAANVVAACFEALGRQPSVISGWFNWFRSCISRFTPRSTTALIAQEVMRKQTPPEMQ